METGKPRPYHTREVNHGSADGPPSAYPSEILWRSPYEKMERCWPDKLPAIPNDKVEGISVRECLKTPPGAGTRIGRLIAD